MGNKDGHKTIGKKLGKMWSKFRQRGKSVSTEATSPTANSKGKSPVPQMTLDASDDDDDEEDEVNNNFCTCVFIITNNQLSCNQAVILINTLLIN